MKIYNPSNFKYITVVEIPKDEIQIIDMDLCAQPWQTLSKYYDACEVKPAIICNGGFFSMADGTTCFNYQDDGEIISTNSEFNEGMGIVNGSLTYGTLGKLPFTDFISAYPVLIENGKKVSITAGAEINYKARRTVLAYNHDNVYVIAVESPGMNFAQLQSFLLQLGVTYAINLDGGGSTKILHDGKSITSAWYNRAVDNVVAIYLKPKTIYRVQLGAFSKKHLAEAFLEKIISLPDTINAGYGRAYIRKINGYYKIQVGAYSIKNNAGKVVNDLKAKGYQAFITTI